MMDQHLTQPDTPTGEDYGSAIDRRCKPDEKHCRDGSEGHAEHELVGGTSVDAHRTGMAMGAVSGNEGQRDVVGRDARKR